MANLQFPYPRKSSMPIVGTSPRSTSLRQRRAIRTYGPPLIGLLATIWLLIYLFSTTTTTSSSTSSSSSPTTPTLPTIPRPPNPPEVIIVTPLDPSLPPSFTSAIRENRVHYAALHNYATFFPSTTAYDLLLPNIPTSWSTVPSLRHAMALHPHTPWIWYLSSTALIMNTTTSLTTRLLSPPTLSSLVIPDHPVVPPNSVIHTPSHPSASRIDLILAQDTEGLAADSLLIRNNDWAKFFLDAWFDPLYRSYNFQKAEGHALEHIVQWHGTVLARLGMVPQRVLNGYAGKGAPQGEEEREKGGYHEGDFVANFRGCAKESGRTCAGEMRPMMERWREVRDLQMRS